MPNLPNQMPRYRNPVLAKALDRRSKLSSASALHVNDKLLTPHALALHRHSVVTYPYEIAFLFFLSVLPLFFFFVTFLSLATSADFGEELREDLQGYVSSLRGSPNRRWCASVGSTVADGEKREEPLIYRAKATKQG